MNITGISFDKCVAAERTRYTAAVIIYSDKNKCMPC
jgi:hypothetical protein